MVGCIYTLFVDNVWCNNSFIFIPRCFSFLDSWNWNMLLRNQIALFMHVYQLASPTPFDPFKKQMLIKCKYNLLYISVCFNPANEPHMQTRTLSDPSFDPSRGMWIDGSRGKIISNATVPLPCFSEPQEMNSSTKHSIVLEWKWWYKKSKTTLCPQL